MEGMVIESFWTNKRVFVTGHTGFKGTWLIQFLSSLGAKVGGYALAPTTSPSFYEQVDVRSIESTFADIRDYETLRAKIADFQPEIILHMAAQPLVIDGYSNPLETYEVNTMGTVNLLEAARPCSSVRSIIIITTDKCYKNVADNRRAFVETDRLGGADPYSSSKACCELVTESYYESFFKNQNIGVATARAGNVIGGGDWASYRLIPDLIRSIETKTQANIRYPKAVRPWQHVLDALSGYLVLAQELHQSPQKFSGAWNFGPSLDVTATVEDVITLMNNNFRKLKKDLTQISISIPSNQTKYTESNFLMLDSSKAQEHLKWQPRWDLQSSLEKVVQWYDAYLNKSCLNKITMEQIREHRIGPYENLAEISSAA